MEEKLYLGVDLRKKSCWLTVLDTDGHRLDSRRLGTEKWELLEFFGKVCQPSPVGPLGFQWCWLSFQGLMYIHKTVKMSMMDDAAWLQHLKRKPTSWVIV